MDLTAFYNLSYGVYVLSSWDEGRPVGCVANSAMQITNEPNTIAVSVNRKNYTHKSIEVCGYFALTVMGEKCDPAVLGTFGFRTSKEINKFEAFPYAVRGKLPVLNGGVCYFVCKLINKMETPTHTVFLGEVLEAENLNKDTPMTYAYYHKVLKGKTAANAPTFIKEEKTVNEQAKYVCKVCGYVYDGETPFEELPDDWICPLCGVGKEEFEKTE